MPDPGLEMDVPHRAIALPGVDREVAASLLGPVLRLKELRQRHLAAREIREHAATLGEPEVGLVVQRVRDRVELLYQSPSGRGVLPTDPKPPDPLPKGASPQARLDPSRGSRTQR